MGLLRLMSAGNDSSSKRSRVGGAIFLAAAVVTVLTYLGLKPSPTPPTPEPRPPNTTPESPKTTTYVDLLQRSSGGNEVSVGAANVRGTKASHGVSIDTTGCTDGPACATFVLPGEFSTLRAVVGIDSSSENGFDSGSMRVKIYTGERVALTTTVSSGSPACSIDVPLEGAREIGFSAYLASGEPMIVAFGDARVVSGKDFAHMPVAARCP
jgi:NPCBM/NEW2 domain